MFLDVVDFAANLEELLSQNIGNLVDEARLAVLLVLDEHVSVGHEVVVSYERTQLDVQVLGVEPARLLMKVRDVHIDLVHPKVLEEHRTVKDILLSLGYDRLSRHRLLLLP